MSYISVEEYRALIQGSQPLREPDADEETLDETPGETEPDESEDDPAVVAALAAAESLIDAATLYGYVGRDPDGLPAYIAGRLREAVAYQAQYILQQGGVDAFNSGDGELGSASLGKFSYGRGSGGSGSRSVGGDLQLSPLARTNIPLLRAYARTLRKEGLT